MTEEQAVKQVNKVKDVTIQLSEMADDLSAYLDNDQHNSDIRNILQAILFVLGAVPACLHVDLQSDEPTETLKLGELVGKHVIGVVKQYDSKVPENTTIN